MPNGAATDVDLRALLRAGGADHRRSCSASAARRSRCDMPDARAAAARRPRPADAGDAEPAVQRGQVRAAAAAAGSSVRLRADGDRLIVEVQRQRPRRAARAAGAGVREVPPGRRCRAPPAGHRPGPADQPPDRRAFRRPHVARVGTGPGRVLRASSCRCGQRDRAAPEARRHELQGADRRRRAEHRRLARVPDEARGLRGERRARRPGGAGRDPRASGPTWCCWT